MDNTQHIIAKTDHKSNPRYTSILDVPQGLLTPEQWRQQGRRLKKSAEYTAVVELAEGEPTTGNLEYISDKLYAFEATAAIRKTRVDPWLDAYWAYFVADHNTGGYIRW